MRPFRKPSFISQEEPSPARTRGAKPPWARQLLAIGVIGALAACTNAQSGDQNVTSTTTVAASADSTTPGTETTGASSDSSSSGSSTVSSTGAEGELTSAATAENALDDHYSKEDAAADTSNPVEITLNGTSAEVASNAVSVDGSTVTISTAGVYRLSGDLEGSVLVDSAGDGTVILILDGATISNAQGAAIEVAQSDETTILLAEGSQNSLDGTTADGDTSTDEEAATAALFSQDDLTIDGDGSLSVTGSNDGIGVKDGLVVAGGTIDVVAADDAVRGKDYVLVDGATLTAEAGDHGVVSDNETSNTTTDATTDTSGASTTTTSAEAAQADAGNTEAASNITIRSGSLEITAASDGLNSAGDIYIEGGELTLNAEDDGVHADAAVWISGGTITVPQSYEGIEGTAITISGGEIDVTTSDDGINISGGVDGSGQMGPGGGGGRGPGFMASTGSATESATQDTGSQQTAQTGDDSFDSTVSSGLTISGGTVVVNADGDGIDANGSVAITGGDVSVFGPTANNNGALDVDGTFTISGARLLAVGSSGMAMAPTGDGQAVLHISAEVAAGDTIVISDADGNTLVEATTPKQVQSIVFSSPEVETGASYQVSVGGQDLGSVSAQG